MVGHIKESLDLTKELLMAIVLSDIPSAKKDAILTEAMHDMSKLHMQIQLLRFDVKDPDEEEVCDYMNLLIEKTWNKGD